MKTILKVVTIISLFLITLDTYAQIDVLSNGNVGIGNSSPTYKLSVAGTTQFSGATVWTNWENVILDWTNSWGAPVIYPSADFQMDLGKSTQRINTLNAYQCFVTAGYYKYSDKRLKKNIKNINSTLSQIKRLQGITYLPNTISTNNSLPKNITGTQNASQYGLIAQDVQKVFPDLVKQVDSSSYLAVDYMGLIPIIIEAIKEQNNTIDSLKTQLNEIHNCCKSGSKTKAYDESIDETLNTTIAATAQTTGAVLYQNAPNPFKESTTIKLEIPETVGNAMVCIYDLNGRQLKCLNVTGRGTTSVQIFGNELTAGLYHYALIVDGALIATKTMVLTE